MTKALFIVPAIAIIAAETVCGLCNLCDNTSSASCDDTIISGATITADGHTAPLSAAIGNGMADAASGGSHDNISQNDGSGNKPDNATGWLLWHIK